MSRRKLPPLASDQDRIEAARLAAESLEIQMKIGAQVKALWTEEPGWKHFIDSLGAVHSEQL